jgi:hypothetical protein
VLGDINVFMRAVDAIHADRTDFKILISIFVSNMAPIADQYPKILALEVFDDRSRFDPHAPCDYVVVVQIPIFFGWTPKRSMTKPKSVD